MLPCGHLCNLLAQASYLLCTCIHDDDNDDQWIAFHMPCIDLRLPGHVAVKYMGSFAVYSFQG